MFCAANWKIPATYTIVKVLDFVFVESTDPVCSRKFTCENGIIYDEMSKYRIF
jgi:hypothetical protein